MAYLPPDPTRKISDERLISFAIRFTHGGVSSIENIHTDINGKILARFKSYGAEYVAGLSRGQTLEVILTNER